MKLSDLSPYLDSGDLVFHCPCLDGSRIRVPLSSDGWQMTGELPIISLSPSIHIKIFEGEVEKGSHLHFTVTNGVILPCP